MFNQTARFFRTAAVLGGIGTFLSPLTLALSPQTLGGEGTTKGTFLISFDMCISYQQP